jgi:flagellar basal-body rod protein FlgC
MSLFNVFTIAGSGMSAETLRLNTTASNLANANTVSSSIDQTYRSRQPVFATMLDEAGRQSNAAAGVEVLGIVESEEPLKMQYQPDHPMADEKGYIYMPNVNVVEEMANMISASRSYQNSVEVANTAKQLAMRVLQLGSSQ